MRRRQIYAMRSQAEEAAKRSLLTKPIHTTLLPKDDEKIKTLGVKRISRYYFCKDCKAKVGLREKATHKRSCVNVNVRRNDSANS